ncbi:hypothetical protein [Aneurinibacillus terranovensis]|uniref:hypothetical protein n=1 Tax=Aneurinibacillus terranovensis TaxID=278991 RepID=UPI00040B98DF|nr:hypothetical protein [Aneurinibacillus terranovensis]
MNLPGFERPVFIARMLNNEFKYINNYPEFDGVIMDANLATNFYKVWGKVKEKRNAGGIKFLMVDPNTAKLEHRLCIEKATYKKLNYCPEIDPLIPDDFTHEHAGGFVEEFVTNVLSTQVELEANILLSPYFVAKTVNSPWYDVNLQLAQKSIEIKEEMGFEEPIYATICISIAELTNESSRQKIIQDYRGLNVDGYYILAEGLADRISGAPELAAFLAFTKELSEFRKPVINGFIDGMGIFASAFGSSGFSAGICWLESFNEQNFTLELEGRDEDSRRERFIYIPEVSMKFPQDRAQLIYSNQNINGLTSHQNSTFYHQVAYSWNDRARYYFLEKRYEELEALKGMNDEQRLELLKGRLDAAIAIARQIYDQDIQIRPAHLIRWRDAIDAAII